MASSLPTPSRVSQHPYPPKFTPFLPLLLENKGGPKKSNKNGAKQTNRRKEIPRKMIRHTYKHREASTHTPRNPIKTLRWKSYHNTKDP